MDPPQPIVIASKIVAHVNESLVNPDCERPLEETRSDNYSNPWAVTTRVHETRVTFSFVYRPCLRDAGPEEGEGRPAMVLPYERARLTLLASLNDSLECEEGQEGAGVIRVARGESPVERVDRYEGEGQIESYAEAR